MKVISILLIILGAIGIIFGLNMFGDIGIACIVGALSALLSGIGFLLLSNKPKSAEQQNGYQIQSHSVPIPANTVDPAVFCVKCGAKLDENSKFCDKCGAAVQ